jgi:DNA polymerase-3 subunit alpha
MEKFAGYGFNKSHSAAYALLSYQTAYLKAHHPAEFLAAQLTCESGNTEKVTTYIAECRDRNIDILPPHVNASASDFHVQDGKVIFGLSAVKNVGEGAIKAILEAREKGGPFCHIHDFAERVDLKKVNKKVIESLIKCGAFDGFGHTRRAMADALDSVIEAGHSFQKDKAQGQFNLFDQECFAGAASAADVSIPPLAEWEELIKLAYEKEMLGFYVTGHPLMKHESLIRKYTNANSLNLPALPEASSVRMAGLVKKVKVVNTKRGDRMAFLSLEDLTGIVEITVFSDLYGQKKEVLQEGEAVMVAGAREANGDGSKILANDIVPLEEAPRHYSNGIHVRLSTTGTDPDQIKSLARILRRHRGRLPVKLHVTIPRQTETIINLNALSCDPSAELLTDVEQAFGYQPITFE